MKRGHHGRCQICGNRLVTIRFGNGERLLVCRTNPAHREQYLIEQAEDEAAVADAAITLQEVTT